MMIKTGLLKYVAMAGVVLVSTSGIVQAGPIFTGSSGVRAASAQFDVSGTNLIVILKNTSSFDVTVPNQVLTALFFTIASDPTLTPVSAILESGSTVFYDSDGQPVSGNVGGEWVYKDGLSGVPGGADEGISSSGLGGTFGNSDPKFGTVNLAGPRNGNVGGLEYGILSAGDNSSTGNGGIKKSGGLIKNSVVFTLSGLPVGFSLYDQNTPKISNVSFQYGTGVSKPNITGGCTSNCTPPPPCTDPNGCSGNPNAVPEPASLGLLGLGLLAMGAIRRRKTVQG